MRRWVIVAAGVAVAAGLLLLFRATPTFIIVKPFVAPASPSGLAVTGVSPAPTSSFPLEVQVDGGSYAARNIGVRMELHKSPTATPVTFFASSLSLNGDTVSGVATRPDRNLFANSDVVTMTWSGQYNLIPGLWRSFSKTTTVLFPVIIGSSPTIPSRGTGSVSFEVSPRMDFPVTIDLAPSGGISLSNNAVTIAVGQPKAFVTVTAPMVSCPSVPQLAPGGTCFGGTINATTTFGGAANVIARLQCVPIQCE